MFSSVSKKIPLLLLALTVLTSAQAQQVRRLTLDEAVSLGMDYSKQLRISQAREVASKAKYQQQFASAAPSVALNSQYQHLSTNIAEIKFPTSVDPVTGAPHYSTIGVSIHDQFYNTLSISQVVFAGLRGFNLLKMSKDQWMATAFDVAADRATIKNNIIVSYYNHYKLLQSKKVVEENIKVTDQRLKDIQNLQSVGMALKNDVLQIDLNRSSLQQSLADVQSAIDVSNYNLGIMLGLPENTQIEIADASIFASKPEYNLSQGLQTAITGRNEIKAGNLRVDAAFRQLKYTRGMYSPILSAGFNYYYSKPNQRVFIEDQIRFHDSWDIGVKLSWNITNIFTANLYSKEAKANIKLAQASQELTADNIKMEVNSNYSAYRNALDKIRLSEKSVEQANENQRLTKDQYSNGVKNVTDMLNADNLAVTTQINLVNARIDAEIAYAKLMKATGNE